MLRKINEKEKTTVILITHNLVQARRLCNQVLFMDRGKVVEYGSGEQVLKTAENPLTQKFVAGELLIWPRGIADLSQENRWLKSGNAVE